MNFYYVIGFIQLLVLVVMGYICDDYYKKNKKLKGEILDLNKELRDFYRRDRNHIKKMGELTQCFYALHENKSDLTYFAQCSLEDIYKFKNFKDIDFNNLKEKIEQIKEGQEKLSNFNEEQYENIKKIQEELKTLGISEHWNYW